MAALHGRNARRPSLRRRKSSARASSVRAAPLELASDGSVDAALKSAEEVISKPQQARAAREAAGSARPPVTRPEFRPYSVGGPSGEDADERGSRAGSISTTASAKMRGIGAIARARTLPVVNPEAWAAVLSKPAPGEEALKRELEAERRRMAELERHVSSRPASSTGSVGPYRPNRLVPSFEGLAVHEPRADNEARIAACRWLKELEKGNTPGVRAPRSTRVADDDDYYDY